MMVKYPILCLATFAIVTWLVGLIIHRTSLDNDDVLIGKSELIALEKPDLAFIGASFVDMGLNPDAFDAVTANQGLDLRSFNLGLGGLSIIEMRYLLTQAIDRPSSHLRYVILVPCFECLNIARDTRNIRSVNFFTLEHSVEFIRYIFSMNVLPEPQLSRYQYVTNILSAMIRHYTNLGLGAVVLGWARLDPSHANVRDPEFWRRRGPRGHAVVRKIMTERDQGIYAKDLPLISDLRPERIDGRISGTLKKGTANVVTDASFEFFVRLVKYLRSRGVAVMVAQPPNLWEWTTEADFVAKIRMRCHGEFPLVDYGDIAAHMDLFLPPSIRYDDAHLNADGALVWSSDLAADFTKLLREGAFDRPVDCLSRPTPDQLSRH